MNKKGISKISQVGFGIACGVSGLIIMTFGTFSGNIWLTRGGIALTTFGMWLISWN